MNVLVFANEDGSRIWLDPRTKLVMLFVVNVIMVSGECVGASAVIRPVVALLPFLLLLSEQQYRPAFLYLIFATAAISAEMILVGRTQGVTNLLVIIFSGLISRFIPGLVMGYYVVSTTKISELIAALEKMHMPQNMMIPFSVMLRFFPTVAEEMAAVNDAMRMRGIRSRRNFGAMLEYRMVPMLICTVKIGEELSAAALTRGLGKPVKRTNVCRIGFGSLDWILLLFSAGSFFLWIAL